MVTLETPAVMTPKGDFGRSTCDTIPSPEKWPSG